MNKEDININTKLELVLKNHRKNNFSFAKKNYSKNYPNNTNNLNIINWSEFEIKNPDTFISMYHF